MVGGGWAPLFAIILMLIHLCQSSFMFPLLHLTIFYQGKSEHGARYNEQEEDGGEDCPKC